MSHSSAKSRAEKSRSVPVPDVTPPPSFSIQQEEDEVSEDVLSKSAWLKLLDEQEEGEMVVAELMEELMEGVMERCYQLYLDTQLVPFSVRWARQTFIYAVEWRFVVRDEGEDPNCAHLWIEESEPLPSERDTWAEGCVPVVYVNPPRSPEEQIGKENLLDLSLEDAEESSNPDTPIEAEPQCVEGSHLPKYDLEPLETDLKSKPIRNSKITPTPPTLPKKSKDTQSRKRFPLSHAKNLKL